MENNYKKLLCAISVIAVIVIIIQLEEAFSSNLVVENTNTIVEEKEVEDNANLNNEMAIKNQTQTTSLSKDNNNENNNNNNNDRFTIGSDLTVFEGEPISLKPLIANAIALPAKSLIYSWNQIEGPKINLPDEAKINKFLEFMAPNRPSDTKYAFELNVVQKTPNGNMELGKDIINILVIDANKVAKGASMNIPSNSTAPSSTSPSPPPPNVPNNSEPGDIIVQGGGQFNPNFRDSYPN
jgi:hypothetical protein